MPPQWQACPPGGAQRAAAARFRVKIFGGKSCVTIPLRHLSAAAAATERALPWRPTNVAGRRPVSFDRNASTQELAMLRITAHDKPRVLTFRLEGRLEGPWVTELEKCWRGTAADTARPTLRVDLSGVTFADAAGKAQLAAMRREGAEFIANDCLTKAIVTEVGGDLSGVAQMSERLTQLRRLHAQLLEVNEELSRAARPLERLDDLDEAQRQDVAAHIRAELARWDAVTREISEVLGSAGANGS